MTRLLTKREVDTARSTEQQQQVAEGKKLAARVDRLRELQATEEASLFKFRCETLKVIQGEIDELIEKRDTLQVQVDGLTILKKNLEEEITSKL